MSFLYTVRRLWGGYRIVKFDDLLNPVRICFCPVNSHGTIICNCWNCEKCRIIILSFITHDRVSKGYFYDWDNRRWELPVTEEFQQIRRRRKR